RSGLVVAAREILQHLELRARDAERLELGIEAREQRAACAGDEGAHAGYLFRGKSLGRALGTIGAPPRPSRGPQLRRTRWHAPRGASAARTSRAVDHSLDIEAAAGKIDP